MPIVGAVTGKSYGPRAAGRRNTELFPPARRRLPARTRVKGVRLRTPGGLATAGLFKIALRTVAFSANRLSAKGRSALRTRTAPRRSLHQSRHEFAVHKGRIPSLCSMDRGGICLAVGLRIAEKCGINLDNDMVLNFKWSVA